MCSSPFFLWSCLRFSFLVGLMDTVDLQRPFIIWPANDSPDSTRLSLSLHLVVVSFHSPGLLFVPFSVIFRVNNLAVFSFSLFPFSACLQFPPRMIRYRPLSSGHQMVPFLGRFYPRTDRCSYNFFHLSFREKNAPSRSEFDPVPPTCPLFLHGTQNTPYPL